MITTEKEALYQIYHTEQLYEWNRISETALKEKLAYFLEILKQFNSSKCEDEKYRINRKYGFSL